MRDTARNVVMALVVAQGILLSGCSCVGEPDFDIVSRGDIVEFKELNVPDCYGSGCLLVIDVINTYHVTVRELYRGDPDLRPDPMTWNTRDDEGHLVPSDVYTLEAHLNGDRVDSWTVIVTEDISSTVDASTDTGGEL